MVLSDIHDRVRSSLGRGTALDAEIPNYVEMAAKWLERNYSFSYMEQLGKFTLDPTDDTPYIIALPSMLTKAINFVRRVGDEDVYTYIHRVSPQQVTQLSSGSPVGYWLQGTSYVMFDAIPTEAEDYEIQWMTFSAWPAELGATHWLITHAPDVLIAETLILFAARLRDNTLRDSYQAIRDEGLRTIMLTDEDLKYQDRDLTFEYGGGE